LQDFGEDTVRIGFCQPGRMRKPNSLVLYFCTVFWYSGPCRSELQSTHPQAGVTCHESNPEVVWTTRRRLPWGTPSLGSRAKDLRQAASRCLDITETRLLA